jgi:hypothetical protein
VIASLTFLEFGYSLEGIVVTVIITVYTVPLSRKKAGIGKIDGSFALKEEISTVAPESNLIIDHM